MITRQFGLQLNRLLHILERLVLVVFLQIEASYPLQWQAINGPLSACSRNARFIFLHGLFPVPFEFQGIAQKISGSDIVRISLQRSPEILHAFVYLIQIL